MGFDWDKINRTQDAHLHGEIERHMVLAEAENFAGWCDFYSH